MFTRFGYFILLLMPLLSACQSAPAHSEGIQLLIYDEAHAQTLTRAHWVEVDYQFAGLPSHGSFGAGFRVEAGKTPAEVAEMLRYELDLVGGDPPHPNAVTFSLGSERGIETPRNLLVTAVKVHIVGSPDETELSFRLADWIF